MNFQKARNENTESAEKSRTRKQHPRLKGAVFRRILRECVYEKVITTISNVV